MASELTAIFHFSQGFKPKPYRGSQFSTHPLRLPLEVPSAFQIPQNLLPI